MFVHSQFEKRKNTMRHITIRQIKIFESVARNLSFSRAAEDLHLTQPAVSMQIKQIEGQAGVPLFHQAGKRVTLTDGGALVLRHCRVILADLKAAEDSLADLVTCGSKRLRVGIVTSGSNAFPHLVHSFVQANGVADLEMTVRPREQLLAMLQNEEIDLALMVREPDAPNMAAQQFGSHPFVLVASPSHALAGASDIPLERVLRECLIVRERGTDTRGVTDETFHDYPSVLRCMEMGCAEAVKQSVIAGIGVSLISALEVQAEVRAGTLAVLDVQGFPLQRHWHAVHRADRPLPAVAQAFQQFLLDRAPASLAQGTEIDDHRPASAWGGRWQSPHITRPAIATAAPHSAQ